MHKIKNFIDGKYVDPVKNQYVENINPALGEAYSEVAFSTKEDVDLAVAAAKAAFVDWKKTSPKERVHYLQKISKLIHNNLDELAKAETIDNGKPLKLSASVDIPRAVENFEFYAHCLSQFGERAYQTDERTFNTTYHSPLGVVGLISPWNLPLYLLSWKVAPALAMGNTMVAKPSEITPMTASLLCQLIKQAGVPDGVFNMVHGHGAEVGAPLCEHPDVAAISFTGSTVTGKSIAQSCAKSFKKVSLEMGGKNPNIIFADCDYDKALKTTVHSSFANQGQICLCGSRIFIEESIYEKFKNDLVDRAKKITVGDPMEANTKCGAIVSLRQFEKVLTYIQLAKQEGGKVLCGGEAITPKGLEKGFFIAPTIIENLDPRCRVNQEEIFGPVVTLTPFKNEEEVLEWANSTEYGLSATVWTQDLTRANHFSRQLHSGIVWVNTWLNRDLRTPFGGVKSSGVGREGGDYALNFFSQVKNICTQY